MREKMAQSGGFFFLHQYLSCSMLATHWKWLSLAWKSRPKSRSWQVQILYLYRELSGRGHFPGAAHCCLVCSLLMLSLGPQTDWWMDFKAHQEMTRSYPGSSLLFHGCGQESQGSTSRAMPVSGTLAVGEPRLLPADLLPHSSADIGDEVSIN